MRFNKLLAAAALAATLCSAFLAQAEILIEDIQLTDRERISRTDFRYEFDVTVRNTGADAENISVAVSSTNPQSDVSLSSLSLATLEANQASTLDGKLVLVQNRRVPFNESDLAFAIDYDEATTLNQFERTFSPNSAYITGIHPNFFVERGIATQEQVDAKIQATYAQLFDLQPAPVDVSETGVVAFSDSFDSQVTNWTANADNGTNPSFNLFVEDGKLTLQPFWNAANDAIAVKFQQISPTDITGGATIEYEYQADPAYAASGGDPAVQVILEDENFNAAFFSFRFIGDGNLQSVVLNDVGPDFNFGFVVPGFDFSRVTGIGFQVLARSTPPTTQGNITFDNVSLVVPAPPGEPMVTFTDNFSAGIDNWTVTQDNGTTPDVSLSHTGGSLAVNPTWNANSDAFTVRYRSFDTPIDISASADITFDVKLPADYVNDGNMAVQLVVEDTNFGPGFIGFAGVSGYPADEFVTLTFSNVGPTASFGFIVGNFDYTQLAGVGLQFVANGKPVDVGGEIEIDNLVISTRQSDTPPPPPVSNTSVLYATPDDLAFIRTIDTNDIRSEGMSYGMMVAVMMDDQETFDLLWEFSKTYMQNKSGNTKDFFAWRLSAEPPYAPLDTNPAPDGEVYFTMALFFAHNRWGSGEGIFDYQKEANDILFDMAFTRTETTRLLMNPEFLQIEFLTSFDVGSFTDPSYHLPSFYELFALWGDGNNQFWHDAAQASRDFFQRSGHPVTGLFADYTTHEGEPLVTDFNPLSHKSAFDSYRVIGNIAMDYHWFSQSDTLQTIIDRQVNFFESEIETFGNFIAVYDVDGTREPGINFRGEGRNAMNGYGATASDLPFSDAMLQSLWDQNAPTGTFRYYDGLLFMFALLHSSGEFKIYRPQEVVPDAN